MHTHTQHTLASVVLTTLLASFVPSMALASSNDALRQKFASGQVFEQDFVLTAYYSPEPDQCCYVKGSHVEDVILNGNGTHGADGTPVYPGMLAAPGSYPFGTRIVLPGLGTFTVHDRGGAIRELDNSHRLDVWAGVGEEGLARALQFGVKKIHGTVYPPTAARPAENVDLAKLPAPLERLRQYQVASSGVFGLKAAMGQTSLSITLIQDALRDAGYFKEASTGLYGQATAAAVAQFQRDFRINEPEGVYTERTSAVLEARRRRLGATPPVPEVLTPDSSAKDITKTQRALRFIGYYRGRTDGKYSQALKGAIIQLQKNAGLIADENSPGAGRIGPQTRAAVLRVWNRTHANALANRLVAYRRVQTIMRERGLGKFGFASKGDQGGTVLGVQKALVSLGLLPNDKATGMYGDMTTQAVLTFQQSRGLVKTAADQGAGTVGPATIMHLQKAEAERLYRLVRAQGWQVL